MTKLDEAHQDLYEQLQAAHRLDAEGQDMSAVLAILVPLEDVVDHAHRVDLDDASPHYRADKSGALVRAAIQLQRNAMIEYARSIGDSTVDMEAVHEHLVAEASDLIDRLTEATSRMWAIARGEA